MALGSTIRCSIPAPIPVLAFLSMAGPRAGSSCGCAVLSPVTFNLQFLSPRQLQASGSMSQSQPTFYLDDLRLVAIPEPSALGLLILAFVCIVGRSVPSRRCFLPQQRPAQVGSLKGQEPFQRTVYPWQGLEPKTICRK